MRAMWSLRIRASTDTDAEPAGGARTLTHAFKPRYARYVINSIRARRHDQWHTESSPPSLAAPTMASAVRTASRPLLRAQLASHPANGHVAFIPQVRKVVIEFCDSWASSAHTRTFIHNHLEDVARAHPHVEFVVKQRTHKEPIARGFYRMYTSRTSTTGESHFPCVVNNRDKVIPLNGFEVNGIANKIQLLLDSSGAKIKPLKRRTIESTTESARGIWSGLHVDEPFKI